MMHDPLRVEEKSGYSSMEAIGRNRSLLGQSMKVDGVASSSSSSWVVNTETNQWKNSIYRVPKWIKKLTNKNAYRPWLVSLGPFHHREADLLPMEEHKCRAVLHLVKRSGRERADFVAAIEVVAHELQDTYQDLDKKWHGRNSRFVEMMVTDGCFLLEFMRAVEKGETVEDYAHNDPVFSTHGIQTLYGIIRSDMLVMENQLPLLALERLEAVQYGAPRTPLETNTRMCKFLDVKEFPDMHQYHGLHPLDILHISICGGRLEHEQTKKADVVIPTAVELREAGVHLKKSATASVRDMSFENGVLSIPERVVDEGTEKELLNLRVFEQLHSGAGSHVINYLSVMDHMIDSERDAELLRSKGIVTNCLRNDKALADLFNNLNCGATTNQHKELNDTLRKVNKHCSKRRNKWRAFFVRTYMRNPWVFISLLAAIILLVATLTQTVYTIVPFYTKS